MVFVKLRYPSRAFFNYINSVRFGGKGIFARIETASETSKYETGSKILALYSSENKIYNVAEQIHGCRLAEMQLDNADYLCTDTKTPYRPQPAYYSCIFSKRSLMTWEHIGDLEKWNTDMFVSYLLASLRIAMIETIYQAFDALSLSYSTIETPVTSGIAKKQLRQVTDALERHVKRG